MRWTGKVRRREGRAKLVVKTTTPQWAMIHPDLRVGAEIIQVGKAHVRGLTTGAARHALMQRRPAETIIFLPPTQEAQTTSDSKRRRTGKPKKARGKKAKGKRKSKNEHANDKAKKRR